jgi:RND family efflux transporter MFP subunit
MRLHRFPTLLLLLIGLACLLSCGEGHKAAADDAANAPSAAVVKVTRGNIADTLEIASEFLPFQEVDVYAKVSGYIQKLNVDYGSHVKKGDVMAVLEIPELQQQLQQDEATAHRSESDLARTEEDLRRAQSAYYVAHVTFTRLADVQKTRPELISQQDIDVSQGKDQEAEAEVSAEKAALAAAQQALAAARAAQGKDQALYDYARMTAPFDGVVTKLYAFTGALLPAGTSSNVVTSSLCRLSQNNLLRLVIPVPERAVPEIHIGQSVAVEVSAMNKTFEGKIVRFSDQIDMDTRTMHTEVQVPNPSYLLVPGMYASVKIPIRSADNVVLAPVQAVDAGQGGKGTVLVVGAGNKLESRSVGIGLQSASEVEITSGLQESESIVYGSVQQFRPGEVITPKQVEPAHMN